jgi:hypothetical protein
MGEARHIRPMISESSFETAAIPIVPSSPVFMGYKGIGFRKLLDNMLGSKAVAHGETGNQRGCN